jgi:hypothetical protein
VDEPNTKVAAKQRREQAKREEEQHRKFDRNLRIIAGVVTVLGAAATTLMKVMEAEVAYRSRNKAKKVQGKVVTRRLKAPPKQKRKTIPAHWRALDDPKKLHDLQQKANAVFKLSQALPRTRYE